MAPAADAEKLLHGEQRPLLSSHRAVQPQRTQRALGRCYETVVWASVLGLSLAALLAACVGSHTRSSSSLEACAWPHLAPHVSLLDVPPISRDEFLARQQRLAAVLDDAGVDAFIAEASASSAYYANLSATHDLSERPFLIIITRDGHFSYLVPEFEAARVAALDMVYDNETVITWPEETPSPYAVLARARPDLTSVMLDEHARFMVADGLRAANLNVVPMTPAVHALRTVKTPAEVDILRGINAFTLALVRSLQQCVRVGVTTEDDVVAAGQGLFARAGVGAGYWALALFGDHAASPHGGSGESRTLGKGEFVLVDIGSVLHGYGSDVTRTFLPRDEDAGDEELLAVWRTVLAAQAEAMGRMRPGEACADVDAASRGPIADAGYARFYTHRLGHGLGLEMHERPYLHGANDEKLRAGEVASNEPGIYVTSEEARKTGRQVGFGVRIEDPILVTEQGGVPLTGRTAQSPWDP